MTIGILVKGNFRWKLALVIPFPSSQEALELLVKVQSELMRAGQHPAVCCWMAQHVLTSRNKQLFLIL